MLSEVRDAYSKVDKWTKPERVGFSLNWSPMSPKLVAEPKGVILIIAPFNLPAFLLLSPLVRPNTDISPMRMWFG